MEYLKTKQFLQDIIGSEEVNFSFHSQLLNKMYHKSSKFTKETAKTIQTYNDAGFDIYFVVNSGGYKKADITRINAVFLDLDSGRDSKGNYFSIDVVQHYKEQNF